MSQGLNKVMLIGNAGTDCETRFSSSGKPVANFSVAVNESFKDGSGRRQLRCEWFRCVAWQKLAEIAGQFITKGKLVYVEGRLQTRKYDGNDGNARTVTEVVVTTLRLLGGSSKNGPSNGQAGAQPAQPVQGSQEQHEDDIPF